jgi:hypothetical protein
MMKSFGAFIVVVLISCGIDSRAQEVWTVGPMVHINFGGGEKITPSFSLEGAYWNLDSFYHSVDFGIEFDRGKFRIYSEAQTGIGLTGLSFGPVLEFHRGHGTHLGVQGSCWINYFLGVDYRIRFIDKKRFHAVGIYGKLPVATSGLDDDDSGDTDWDWD